MLNRKYHKTKKETIPYGRIVSIKYFLLMYIMPSDITT